jgi:hypothetical protein
MIFLTGPRQIGKTHLARQILSEYSRPQYLDYDATDDARIIASRSWSADADILVFDEIHKMKGWKRFLKGVYDTRRPGQAILVAGSSRMETFRQSGESLAGRYFHYRFQPFSVREAVELMGANEALDRLNRLGGFPEPFLSGSEEEADRWRSRHYADLIREDIPDFSRVHELRTMRLLLEMLRERVGLPLSFTGLAGDLQIAPNTVRRYVEILEGLYIVFLVRPFHRNVARAIRKEPKAYFFDTGLVKGGEGIRLENTVAVSLQKYASFLQDAVGETVSLQYLRTKEKREVDFVLSRDENVTHLIEVKLSEPDPSPHLLYFRNMFPEAVSVQLVRHLKHERDLSGVSVRAAAPWLRDLAV